MNVQMKIGDQTFRAEVGNLNDRPILVTVDGEQFEVWPEEEKATPTVAEPPSPAPELKTRSVPVASASTAGSNEKSSVVYAPIPGQIVALAVSVGDTVVKGQELCSLEAMKMKNAIRSPRDGQISAVLVQVGDHVKKGHPLVEFAD